MNRAPCSHSHFRLQTSSFSKSAQSDLNRPNCPGRAARYRYIMGAKCFAELSKIQEHKAGLEPTLPHYECGVLAAERPEPALNWDRTDLNRGHRSAWMPDWSNPVKSRVCCR